MVIEIEEGAHQKEIEDEAPELEEVHEAKSSAGNGVIGESYEET